MARGSKTPDAPTRISRRRPSVSGARVAPASAHSRARAKRLPDIGTRATSSSTHSRTRATHSSDTGARAVPSHASDVHLPTRATRRARPNAFGPDWLATQLAALIPGFPHTPLCVALSGGVDSTALLAALAAIHPRPAGVRALHVDHGLRAASHAWAQHCRDLARRLHVPLHVLTTKVKRSRGASLEATARDARYRLLTSALQPGEVLLLAHHADDQLETVLLQLLRGSGLPGIAAMPAMAPFASGFLARPLLSRSRAELEAWVRGQGLTWIEDDSNADETLNRNYLRRRILPLIRERWPGSATAVARSARHAAEAQSLLDKLARDDIERASYGESLSVKALRALPADRLNNALRFWITRAGARAPDTRRLEEIAGPLMTARDDANPFVEWGDGAARVQRHNDLLALSVRADALSADTDPLLDDAQPTASPFRADAQPAARANVPSAADAQPTARANVPSAADAQPTARANAPSAADAQPTARANVPSAADAQSAASANALPALNHARSAGTNVPNAHADSQSAGANELPTFAASLPTSARAHSAHSKSGPVEATAPLVWPWRDSPTCHLPHNLGKLELQPDAHGPIDLDALPHPLTIRWRRGGERLAPRRGGSRRALKSLLQESHVPVSERSRLPLLVAVTKSGEKLLAVADLLVDETVQATSATRRRARLRWMKALR